MNSKYMYFDTKEQAQEYIEGFGTNRPDISFSNIIETDFEGTSIMYRVIVKLWPLD
jgi:viroplasmin and RNaseH domain-containing protein